MAAYVDIYRMFAVHMKNDKQNRMHIQYPYSFRIFLSTHILV